MRTTLYNKGDFEQSERTTLYNKVIVEQPRTIDIMRELLNDNEIEKAAFCGLGLITIISNNKMSKIILSAIFVRKLYKIYMNNKNNINMLLDRIL